MADVRSTEVLVMVDGHTGERRLSQLLVMVDYEVAPGIDSVTPDTFEEGDNVVIVGSNFGA